MRDRTRRASLQEKMGNLRPSPKYLSRYGDMRIVSDRWLDRLVLDGYDVEGVMGNLMQRMAADPERVLSSLTSRSQALLQAKPAILDSLSQLRLHQLPQQSIVQLQKSYSLHPQSCKQVLTRYHWPYKQPPQLYQALQDRGVRVRVVRDAGLDVCVVFANCRMRELYGQLGEVVSLEFRFVPVKRAANGMHYNLGMFLGQDRGARVVVFGLALINGLNYKNIKACLHEFLKIMEYRLPNIIITSHQKFYQQLVSQINSQLGSQIQHITNWHYSLQKLKISLTNEPMSGQALRKLSSALSATSPSEYQAILAELRQSRIVSEEFLQEFQRESSTCCFVGASPRFVGFGVQDERVGLVDRLVKESFFYVRRVGMFYSLAFRMEWKCNRVVEDAERRVDNRPAQHRIAQMRYLSTIMQPNLYTKLSHIYSHSLTNLNLSPTPQPLTYTVRDTTKQKSKGTYKVQYSLQSSCWQCSCTLIYWSGLPCEHLIKIVRYFGGSIGYYVCSRWSRDGYGGGGLRDLPAFQVDQEDNAGSYRVDGQRGREEKI